MEQSENKSKKTNEKEAAKESKEQKGCCDSTCCGSTGKK
jgi:hypothetical protein